jgi:hypothetical protein
VGVARSTEAMRDYDGRVRLIAKLARSRAAAERALKAELSDRQTPSSGGAITSTMRLTELADIWLAGSHGWSSGTERVYRSAVNSQVKPALGQLRIREVTPGVVSRALTAIARRNGPSAAKTVRACLSGMFRVAIEDSAIATNPVRDSVARISVAKKAPRALTVDERNQLMGLLRASAHATELDIPDLVDWMSPCRSAAESGRIGDHSGCASDTCFVPSSFPRSWRLLCRSTALCAACFWYSLRSRSVWSLVWSGLRVRVRSDRRRCVSAGCARSASR